MLCWNDREIDEKWLCLIDRIMIKDVITSIIMCACCTLTRNMIRYNDPLATS